jgi:hypothetical protein
MLRSPLPCAAVAAITVASANGGGQAEHGRLPARERSAPPAGTTQPRLPTIVFLPDTQYYASAFPDILAAQTSWIAHEQQRLGIAGVVQAGDLVDTWSSPPQWKVVSSSMRILDNRVPYLVVPGNHDTDSSRNGLLDSYFAPSTMPWISGTMVPGKIDDNFALLDIGPRQWLVLGLEFGPRDAALDWAGSVLRAHAELPAIIVTHAYLYEDGTRYGSPHLGMGDHPRGGQRFAPQEFDYTPTQGINDGEQIWRKLVVPNANVQLVLCGHDNGVARLTSRRPDGSRVQQILADYQWLHQGADDYRGGSGFLRLLEFDYDKRELHVETYSPYLDQSLTDDGNRFTLVLDL